MDSNESHGHRARVAARYSYVDGPFGQMHVAESGSGTPLVVLGDNGRSGRQFEPLLPFLASRYRVICPDIPGLGRSAALPEGVGLPGAADSMVGMLDALGISQAHWFGVHTGAKVVTAIGDQHPTRAASLIVAGKSHSIIPETEPRVEAMRSYVAHIYMTDATAGGPDTIRSWAVTGRNVAASWWQDAIFDPRTTPETIRAVESHIIDQLLARRETGRLYELNFEYDFTQAFSRIVAPTLILEYLSDYEDRQFGRHGERLRAHLPAATVKTLDEVTHESLGLGVLPAALASIIAEFVDTHS